MKLVSNFLSKRAHIVKKWVCVQKFGVFSDCEKFTDKSNSKEVHNDKILCRKCSTCDPIDRKKSHVYCIDWKNAGKVPISFECRLFNPWLLQS